MVLKPVVSEMIRLEFPRLSVFCIDTDHTPALAAGEMVYTVPVVLVYFEDRLSIRLIRNFSIDEFRRKVERY
jgi:hypothetical protein